MFEFIFNNFDLHLYSVLEDIFVIIMLYSFIKLTVLSSIIELVWPTQFFNKRNSMGVVSFRLRSYTETLLKLRTFSNNFSHSILLLKFC